MLNKFGVTKSKNKGIFISFEGGEGCGKTTQIKLLKEHLINQDKNVLATREPGGTTETELIRKSLVSGNINNWDSISEALIFTASRRQHLNKVIIPSLNLDKIVLCDRFFDSTLIYQGYVGKVDDKILNDLHDNFCYGIMPNLTFFLDINPDIGLKRSNKRNKNKKENRFEKHGLEYHNKISEGFKIRADLEKNRIITINANLNISDISIQIIKFVDEMFKKK